MTNVPARPTSNKLRREPVSVLRLAAPAEECEGALMEERIKDRAFERFALEIPTRTTICAAPALSGMDGLLVELGGGGMKFESPGIILEGTPVTMTLWTRWGSFTLVGKVVWSRLLNGEIVYGVELDVPIGNARARELYEEVTSAV